MATVRMYRGHWVADYYDANQRRRIERPQGYFEKAKDELRAAHILLADRFASLMISNGEDIVRVSRLMGHATASFTLNVYSHMLPREHDASGDRLASLVFGNKMETVANLPTRLEWPSGENLSESA